MEQIIRYNKLDSSKLTFSDVKPNRYGGKTVHVKYGGKTLMVQTPKMYLPYGLGEYQVKDSNGNPTGDVKYSLDMSFKGWDSEGPSAVKTFYENMQKLDGRLVDEGVANRVSWFKSKNHTKEVVEALYSPALRFSKDRETGEVTTKWPPTMKAKVYQAPDGSFKAETYNDKRVPVEFRPSVVKGCYVQALVSCSSVWFAGGKFGMTWQVRQMIVHPPMRLTGFSFLVDEDDVDASAETPAEETSNCQFYADEDSTEEVAVTEVFTEEEEVVELVEEVVEAAEEEEVKPKKKKRKTVKKPRKSAASSK